MLLTKITRRDELSYEVGAIFYHRLLGYCCVGFSYFFVLSTVCCVTFLVGYWKVDAIRKRHLFRHSALPYQLCYVVVCMIFSFRFTPRMFSVRFAFLSYVLPELKKALTMQLF